MTQLAVIRHTERRAIKSAEKAPAAPLTFKGRREALKCGKFFGDLMPGSKIITSNIKRCYTTGKIINKSVNGSVEREDMNGLVTGYVKPDRYLSWLRNYHYPLYSCDYERRFRFWNKVGMLRYSTIDEYARAFFGQMCRKINIIAVGHDSTIIPLIMFLAKHYGFPLLETMRNPKYLCGFIVDHEEGEITAVKWFEFPDQVSVLYA